MGFLTTPDFNAPTDAIEALGFPVIHVPETTSTQDNIRELWNAAEAWTTVCTDYQSAGRGRLGRTWESERGRSLLASTLVCVPDTPATPAQGAGRESIGWIPLIAAVSLRQVLAVLSTDQEITVKWPNDLVVEKNGNVHKLAGILGEFYGAVNGELRVGLGVGCNISQDALDLFPGSTSLAELGVPGVERPELLVAYLKAFQARMERWGQPKFLADIVAELNTVLAHRGKEIHVAGCVGVVQGVDIDANLQLLADGQPLTVTTEDLALHIAERSEGAETTDR